MKGVKKYELPVIQQVMRINYNIVTVVNNTVLYN